MVEEAPAQKYHQLSTSLSSDDLSHFCCAWRSSICGHCACVYASAYVSVCVCVPSLLLCVCGHKVVCLQCILYMCCLRVFNAIQTPPIGFLSGLILSSDLICHFFKPFKTVREKWALFPVADQYINSTAGDSSVPSNRTRLVNSFTGTGISICMQLIES